jgi:class 3 adenylate cyclase/tetratricopeptide (TPR) repeat protein
MQCIRCQAENRDGTRFCSKCGTALTTKCPSCGFLADPVDRFCGRCGAVLAAARARFASPEAYTPKHLADKILTSRSALEGERKHVTVLFADMKGSTELLADSDPEEARAILDPVLELMMEAIHRFEGTVNQVMGDGIMALFGAPVAHEDHAVRACYAALWMQDAVKRHGEQVRQRAGFLPQIRVGLNSGEVVVRSVGSDLRMDYTAVGLTTHLAARMEQMAVPGSVLVTADTLKLSEGFVGVRPLGRVTAKGLTEPIEAYELIGPAAARTRLQATAGRGLTGFVGRGTEMEHLRRALERAGSGHGQVVALVGEPGMGKSRLFFEIAHSAHARGWLILESGSVSYGKATPYLPVIELLRAHFQIDSGDSMSSRREKITRKVLALDRALEPLLPPLLGVFDVAVDDAEWLALDPAQRRQRILDCVKRLLLCEASVQPVLLIVEDLHWIDGETQALLDSLVLSLPAARILLLVNYRPEYEHAWGQKTYYTQLRIDPLSRETSEQFLELLLGHDTQLIPLKRLLIERTEGNPFFLEESVRTLIETKVLIGTRGAYRLARPIDDMQMPATVHAVLAARIDRLSHDDKRLLQCSATIGHDISFSLLQAVADEHEEPLRNRLSRLQAAEFLYETSQFPEPEYAFRHALTHDVAYGSLLHERRRTLHARIADAIEQLYADRLAEKVERLAHHAIHGETWPKAVRYAWKAGAKAFERSANRESVAWYERALAALGRLPESQETLKQAIDIRFDLRNALFQLGELETMRRHLDDAARLTEALGDVRRVGWVAAYMSQYFLATARSREAREFGERAFAIANEVADLSLQIAAGMYLGQAWLICDPRKTEEYCRRVVQLVPGHLTRERRGQGGFPAVTARAWLTLALAEQGKFQEAIRLGEEGLGIAEALDHPFSLVNANWALGYLHGARGEMVEAIKLLERAVSIAREWNLALLLPIVSWFLGLMYTRAGRVDDGLALLHGVLTRYESARIDQSPLLVHVGEARLLSGRLDDALALADRALTLTDERDQPAFKAWTLRIIAEIASRRDPPDIRTATTCFQSAMAIAGDLEMRPLMAHCHNGLGQLYRRTNKWQEAEEHLAAAVRMYREMDMGSWPAQEKR